MSNLRPENPIPRTLCAWYGFHLTIGDVGQLLSDSRGNECPWVGTYSECCPCTMEMEGENPNASRCPVAAAAEMTPALILGNITVWARELLGITFADAWQEYVMSPSCPRVSAINSN